MIAQEDPENYDTTLDAVEDEFCETQVEKLDNITEDIIDFKRQLGLDYNPHQEVE